MNIDKAIELLQDLRRGTDYLELPDTVNALSLGINALKRQKVTRKLAIQLAETTLEGED